MGAIAEHIKAKNLKSIGYIGYSDTWGDLVYKASDSHAGQDAPLVRAVERVERPGPDGEGAQEAAEERGDESLPRSAARRGDRLDGDVGVERGGR